MMFKDIVDLIRVRQWYKNAVIFIPLIFAFKLLDVTSLLLSFAGFICLCLLSSSYYIINDLKDVKSDAVHPEKKDRPLASGSIKKKFAFVFAILLFLLSIFIGWHLSKIFCLLLLAIFAIIIAYTFILKKILFADVLTIAAVFAIKALSGVFIINTPVSPWLVVSAFFLSAFLAFSKRKADLVLLKDAASQHKVVLKEYSNLETTNMLLVISAISLLLCYVLYIVVLNKEALLLTMPFVIFGIAKYIDFVNKGDPIARHPEKVFAKFDFVLNMVLWLIIVVFVMYFKDTILKLVSGL